jgi:hypothetical protein
MATTTLCWISSDLYSSKGQIKRQDHNIDCFHSYRIVTLYMYQNKTRHMFLIA